MTDDPAKTRTSRWRYLLWIVIFLLGILIGWLLAPRLPGKTCSNGAVGQLHGSASDGSGAPGHPASGPKSGSPDSVNLSGSGMEPDQGSGRPRPGGEAPAGGLGNGRPRPGDDHVGGIESTDQKGPPVDMPALGASLAPGSDADLADASGRRVLKATDFRYDKTGLPRYPQSVGTIASTLTYDRGTTGGYHSTCAIVTSSGFADVVDWYKTHLPPDWHALTVGDVAAVAQQVSVDNIMKTLTAATQAPDASANTVASAAHTDRPLGVAMFSPPPGTSGEPSILIRQKAGEEVVITMSRAGSER